MNTKKIVFKKENIPNYLTILRIIFMILVIVFILVHIGPNLYYLPLNFRISSVFVPFSTNYIVAGSFFILASLTDFLDGHIARKYNWISDFGKLWDPLADKLLINGVLICLAYKDLVPVWLVVILILRDFIVDAFRMESLRKNIIISASWNGKIKTFFEMFGIIFVFFFFNFSFTKAVETNQIIDWYLIQNLFILIATFFSLVSMCEYIYKFNKNKINNN